MQIFYSHASPFARKVLMHLHVTGLITETELILSNFNSNELRHKNPLGKIPALIDGDRSLFDSALICDYLDIKAVAAGKKSIFLRDTEGYFDSQISTTLANGITEAAVSTMMERKRETEHSNYWLERWHTACHNAIEIVNVKHLGSKENITIATLAMIAALGYMDFRLADYRWREWNPELSHWYESFVNEDWVTATAPKN